MLTKNKQLSVNKLAEYLDAYALRRAAIVKQQKSGNGHPAQYYSLAQAAMTRVLISGDPDDTFQQERISITDHPGWGPYPQQLISNNIQAFDGLMAANSDHGLLELPVSCRKPAEPLVPRQYGDVRLSNRFDVELLTEGRKKKYGGIKYYLNKEHPLSDFSGAVLASMLVEATGELVGKNAVSSSHVFVIDAFNGKIFSPPSKLKRHLDEAVAAAREFSMHWDLIV
jgi:hypothetical protein